MHKITVVVDCNDAGFAQAICQSLAADTGIQAVLPGHPAAVDARYACCWFPDPRLLTYCPSLRLIQAASAGVDHLPEALFEAGIPLCRIMDDGLRHGMLEYALWGILYYQRHFDRVLANQPRQRWQRYPQRPAQAFRVGVMGLGETGGYIAWLLASLGYEVSGWARSMKQLDGVRCYAGDAQLPAFLGRLDALINVLPLTDNTRGILAQRLFEQLPQGAVLINCGRGEHMNAAHVLAALESGQLAGAMLDVFPQEPLPQDDPLWRHPKVVITPHMASAAPVAVITGQLLENIQRCEAGLEPNYLVDKQKRY